MVSIHTRALHPEGVTAAPFTVTPREPTPAWPAARVRAVGGNIRTLPGV
jgi:hypothetical protein